MKNLMQKVYKTKIFEVILQKSMEKVGPFSTCPIRGGSRTAATSKMERVVIIVDGWNPLTIITKHSILVVAAALDPPLPIFRFDFHLQSSNTFVKTVCAITKYNNISPKLF